jgi:hypothetical protein
LEDYVAHTVAIIQTSGFFLLAFAALLGFVNISNAATATFLGTVMGYAVGKVDPILNRYFVSHSGPPQRHPVPRASNGAEPAGVPSGSAEPIGSPTEPTR